ncbi:MAG: GNAT family N-acetyltransferase [Microgenomates group bacterium]
MQIDRIAEWDLQPEIEIQIAELLGGAFETDFGGRSYFMQRPHLRYVAQRDGRLIGHLSLTYRAIRIGARLCTVAGVCDVATLQAARGQGVAGLLLQAAMQDAQSSPAEFILLFGDAGLYGAAGFHPVDNLLHYVDMSGAQTGQMKTANDDGLMVLPLRGAVWDHTVQIDLLGPLF